MKLSGIALGLFAALVVTGCATVRSTRVDEFQIRRYAGGITYFLPTRMVKMTATRTPLKIADLVKDREAKAAELVTAKEAAAAADKATKAAKAVLDAMAVGAPAYAQAAIDLSKAEAVETTLKKRLADATTAAASSVAAVELASTAGVPCSYSAKLELLPPQADPDQRFIAQMVHSPLRDDSLTLKVTPAGLLSSGNVVAADRTGDIIVELAGAIAALGVRGGDAAAAFDTPDKPVDCTKLPSQFVEIMDPVRGLDTVKDRNDDSVAIASLNSNLATAQFPFRVRADMSAMLRRPSNELPAGGRGSKTRFSPSPEYVRDAGAIYYRSAIPVTLSLEQNTNSIWRAVDAAIVTLPQAGPISYIPLNSSAFVKTVDDVQFTDGSIASWTADRPSEVLEIVRLPVRILTAIVSIPAALIKLRVDYSSQAEALAIKQQAEIAAAGKLAALNRCITLAEAEGRTASTCFGP